MPPPRPGRITGGTGKARSGEALRGTPATEGRRVGGLVPWGNSRLDSSARVSQYPAAGKGSRGGRGSCSPPSARLSREGAEAGVSSGPATGCDGGTRRRRLCALGLADRGGPWFTRTARATRQKPALKEPGGGRRDSSGGRGAGVIAGDASGGAAMGPPRFSARDSPQWWQCRWLAGFGAAHDEQSMVKPGSPSCAA